MGMESLSAISGMRTNVSGEKYAQSTKLIALSPKVRIPSRFLIDRQQTVVYAEINAGETHRIDLSGLLTASGVFSESHLGSKLPSLDSGMSDIDGRIAC